VVILWLLACRPAVVDSTDSVPPGDTGPVPSHETDIASLWEQSCLEGLCHGVDGDAPLRLDPEQAWRQLVDRPALEAPMLDLVEPGRPDQSYLLFKLRGTQIEAGGMGQGMPFEADPLPEQDLALVEAWIRGGALP